MPAATASAGWAGVDGTLTARPSGVTRSVNVPPVSDPMRMIADAIRRVRRGSPHTAPPLADGHSTHRAVRDISLYVVMQTHYVVYSERTRPGDRPGGGGEGVNRFRRWVKADESDADTVDLSEDEHAWWTSGRVQSAPGLAPDP